jgi:hypothetical protein
MNFAKLNLKAMLLFLYFLLPAVLLSGCGVNHHQLYKEIERVNTIGAYEEYLQKYPNSPYSTRAHNQINSIKFEEAFAKAMKDATPQPMAALLQKHPNSRRIQEGLQYKNAQQARTRKAYEEYLKEYPNGEWAGEAISKITDIMDPPMKDAYEQAGRVLATKWVTLLDEGRWSEASSLYECGLEKPFGNRQDLEDFLRSVRQAGEGVWRRETRGMYRETGILSPLRIVSRKVESASYFAQYGKRPLGDYVVVIFNTVFEHSLARETIIAVRTSSGKWSNDGYLIHLQR